MSPNPANPIIKQFLVIIRKPLTPFNENQYVQRSIIAGKANPSAERLSAPKRDMNKSM